MGKGLTSWSDAIVAVALVGGGILAINRFFPQKNTSAAGGSFNDSGTPQDTQIPDPMAGKTNREGRDLTNVPNVVNYYATTTADNLGLFGIIKDLLGKNTPSPAPPTPKTTAGNLSAITDAYNIGVKNQTSNQLANFLKNNTAQLSSTTKVTLAPANSSAFAGLSGFAANEARAGAKSTIYTAPKTVGMSGPAQPAWIGAVVNGQTVTGVIKSGSSTALYSGGKYIKNV